MAEINSTIGTPPPGTRSVFRQECLFWSTAAVLLFVFLWSSFHWEHEVIQAEITREMLVSGNWLHPALNWQVFPEKPALSYWLMFPFVKLFGFSEFAVRLPGVFAALGALWALRVIGKRLFNERIAGISCWLFLGSAGLLFWGRNAAAEMISVMVVLWAAAWFLMTEERKGFGSYLVFYLLCFCGALFNGLTTAVVPFMILTPLAVCEKSWKEHWNKSHFAAFLLASGCYISYFYVTQLFPFAEGQSTAARVAPEFPELLWYDLVLWYRHFSAFPENWLRSWKEFFFFLLPWTPILPVGVAGLLKNWQTLSFRCRVLFVSVWCTLFFCTFFNTSSFGAVLPLLPFVLLFCAAGFGGMGVDKWNQTAFSAAYYFCTVAASLCICSIITYPLWDKIAAHTPPAPLVLGPVAAGVLGWMVLFMDHRPNNSMTRLLGMPHRIGAVLFAGTMLSGCALSVILPVVSREFDTEKRFFRELHRKASEKDADGKCPVVVSFAHAVPAAYLFYNGLSAPVPVVDDLELLLQKYPGKQAVLFMKNRRSLLGKLDMQCKKYGLRRGNPLLAEEVLRWYSPDSRKENFVAYLITLPGERIKER